MTGWMGVYEHPCKGTFIPVSILTSIYIFMMADKQDSVCIFIYLINVMYTCLNPSIQAYIHACQHTYTYTDSCISAYIYAHSSMSSYIHTYKYGYIYTDCMFPYTHKYINMDVYLHIYVHAYIHTSTHLYISAYIPHT